MALRDQPYIPLYVQDIMTDEKLNECCAATHGIFIKGIMCLMHKSEEYGKILLKQKDQQTDNTVKNFALKIKKHTPYTVEEIEAALFELIAEKVLTIEGDSLCQKRMIEDNRISQLRSEAGKTSADVKKTKKKKGKKFVETKAPTKRPTSATTPSVTKPENEYEGEIESENEVVAETVSHGKFENFFHGNVPADLVALANRLKPSAMKSEQWQRWVALEVEKLGYEIILEAACPYPNEDAEEVEGFIDIRAVKNNCVVCIECDNRVTTRDSVTKIICYAKQVSSDWDYSGMVLLRDPKPVHTVTVELPVKPLLVNDTLHPELPNVYTEIFREGLIMAFRDVDVDQQWEQFKVKVRNSPKFYSLHDLEGLRMAFSRHLQSAPRKQIKPDKKELTVDDL